MASLHVWCLPIVPCTPAQLITSLCFPQDIIKRIRVNNHPQIPLEKVLGFSNRADAEKYMAEQDDAILGAVHFVERPGGKLEYVLQGGSAVRELHASVGSIRSIFRV